MFIWWWVGLVNDPMATAVSGQFPSKATLAVSLKLLCSIFQMDKLYAYKPFFHSCTVWLYNFIEPYSDQWNKSAIELQRYFFELKRDK